MKLSSALFAASVTLLATAPALASQELATKKNCLTCHQMQAKSVGPSYKDVAAKYAGQKDAVDMLAKKIIKGGSGAWGPVPMPPNAVSEVEAKQLATWVLTVK
jgi:cytochrome c